MSTAPPHDPYTGKSPKPKPKPKPKGKKKGDPLAAAVAAATSGGSSKKKGTSGNRVTLQEVVTAAIKAGIPKEYIPYFASIIYAESGGHYDPVPNTAGASGPGQVLNLRPPRKGEDIHAWAMYALDASAKHFRGNISDNPGNIQYAIGAYFAGQGNINLHGLGGNQQDAFGTTAGKYVANVVKLSKNISNIWGSATPAGKSTAKALQAQADASNADLIAGRVDIAQQTAAQKAALHITDPWVTVNRDKKGNIIGLGQATGYVAPKNVLKSGGVALTQSNLSNLWGARYQDIFEAYTGRVPTAADMAKTISAGLTPYGLQAQLAAKPGFANSPIYKQKIGDLNATSLSILGINAPHDLVVKSIAENWDPGTFAQRLRYYVNPKTKARPYLSGPEFTNASSSMTATYQKIYGRPDANAVKNINEAAANGWTAEHFGQFLREQPAYKTSVEYQSHAMDFLDQMGMLLKARPGLVVGQPDLPAGGKAVPNSPLVPGQGAPLGPVLNTTPTLAPVKSGD